MRNAATPGLMHLPEPFFGLIIKKGADSVLADRLPRAKMPQLRNYFRIKFPVTQRPCLIVKAAQFEVTELAEAGARIIVNGAGPSDTTGEFDGTIEFADGVTAPVTARVHRREGNEAILRFAANLPYSIIAGQQRRLLQLFPREAASPAR